MTYQRNSVVKAQMANYNGGKVFSGRVLRVSGDSVLVSTKNGRSRVTIPLTAIIEE